MPVVKPPKRYCCDHCRRSKLKCDKALPTCDTCTKAGRTCSYSKTARKPTVFSNQLDQRNKDISLLSPLPSPVVTASMTPKNTESGSSESPPCSDMVLLSPQSSPSFTDGLGTAYSFPPFFEAVRSSSDGSPTVVTDFFDIQPQFQPQLFVESGLPILFKNVKPRIDIHYDLIEQYFRVINKTHNMFNETYFMRNVESLPPLVLCSMYARICGMTPGKEDLGNQFYQMTKSLLSTAMEQPSPEVSIILVDLAYYAIEGDPYGWALLGLSCRIAQMLNLNRETVEEASKPSVTVEQEMRRRAWWFACNIDTFGWLVCRNHVAIKNNKTILGTPLPNHIWEISDLPSEKEAEETQVLSSSPYMDNGLEGAFHRQLSLESETGYWKFHIRLLRNQALLGKFLDDLPALTPVEQQNRLIIVEAAFAHWLNNFVTNMHNFGIHKMTDCINPQSPAYQFMPLIFEFQVSLLELHLPFMVQAMRADLHEAHRHPSFVKVVHMATSQVTAMQMLAKHGRGEILKAKMRMTDDWVSGIACALVMNTPVYSGDPAFAAFLQFCIDDLEYYTPHPIAYQWWQSLKELQVIPSENLFDYLAEKADFLPI